MHSVSLKRYVAKRILQAIPLVLFVVILNFTLIHMAPGDPLMYIIGEEGLVMADDAYLDALRTRLGLNRPVHEQLLIYLGNVVKGDLGYSFIYNQPVLQLILERIPATLLLILTALVVAAILGVVLGVVSAQRRHSPVDYFATTVSLLGYSLPTFWLAQMMVLLFSIELGLLPTHGMTSVRSNLPYFLDVAIHLILPAVTLGTWYLAWITRQTRSRMLEVLTLDFITTARSKGLNERTVLYKHALKNALLPVITIISMNLGFMFAGAILTETVFGWPGLGRLLYQGLIKRDYPVVLGMLLIISIMVNVMNLVADVLYSVVDPRIRYK